MSDMLIDIHNHSLLGLDDGAKSLEESLEMIKVSNGEGVSNLVFTPHYRDRIYNNTYEIINERYESIKNFLDDFKGINFHLGAEVFLCSNIPQMISSGVIATINRSRYFLLELPDYLDLRILLNIVFEIKLNGYIPVISHIERNNMFLNNFKYIGKILEAGCLIQITAASICGRFGREIEKFTFKLIESNGVHVVASDAHNLRRRTPELRSAYNIINTNFGKQYAKEIFFEIPLNLINNDTITERVFTGKDKIGFCKKFLDKIW